MKSRLRVRILALVLVFGFCSAVAEVGLRVKDRVLQARTTAALPPVAERALVPSTDPGLVYELRPGYDRDGFSINAFGMPDGPVTREKPAGMRRVAVVGDSISCGFKLSPPRPQNWVSRLRDRLASSNVQVLNFAVNGYGALQDLRMARARALGFAPDLILVQLCLNDPHSSDVDALWSGPQPFFRLSSTLLRLFHYERHVAYFAVDRFYDTKGLAQLDRAFAGFSEIARAGTPVAAVLFPYLHRAAYHDWGFAEYHRRFDEAARRHQVPLLDLRETFERAGLIREIGPADAVHPDAAGHTLAATEVTAWLETQGFMER